MIIDRPVSLDGYTIVEHNIRVRIQTLRLDMLYHHYLSTVGKMYLNEVEYEVESQELLKLQVAQKHLTDGIVYPEFMDWDGKTFDGLAWNDPDNIRAAEFMYERKYTVKKESKPEPKMEVKKTAAKPLFSQTAPVQKPVQKAPVKKVEKSTRKLF